MEHNGIDVVDFEGRKNNLLGVEVLRLSELRQRAQKHKPLGHLSRPQRLEMVMFVLYSAGAGVHMIDFESYEVRAGHLLFVPQHSIHKFPDSADMEATVLVMSPAFILPERLMYLKSLLADRPWPLCSELTVSLQNDFEQACQSIVADQMRYGSEKHLHPWLGALLHQRVYTWLLHLRMHWASSAAWVTKLPAAYDVVFEFKKLLETHVLSRWTVQDYAQKLGCAERTLSRACWASEGKTAKTAKTILDERLALEAQRILVNSLDSIESIALRLGFASTSNFVQFFKRLTGRTPSVFRRMY
ncbi:MAG: AraC family transcriptional regulator [Formosimonas sp.]